MTDDLRAALVADVDRLAVEVELLKQAVPDAPLSALASALGSCSERLGSIRRGLLDMQAEADEHSFHRTRREWLRDERRG